MTASTAQARPGQPRRRPAAAVPLASLRGPSGGMAVPPRRLWWSGSPAVNLDDRGQTAVFYESALDTGTAGDLADWLNADLLMELWPSLGMRSDVQRAWEAVNPQLARRTAA